MTTTVSASLMNCHSFNHAILGNIQQYVTTITPTQNFQETILDKYYYQKQFVLDTVLIPGKATATQVATLPQVAMLSQVAMLPQVAMLSQVAMLHYTTTEKPQLEKGLDSGLKTQQLHVQ